MAMCVEVSGCGVLGDELGFEIESVEIEVTGGAGAGDVDVKVLDVEGFGTAFPVLLDAADQYNFLYALSYSGQDNSTFDPLPPPLPIHVTSSPSQRFTAKMGDFPEVASEGPALAVETNWARNVGIIVRGRPVRVRAQRCAPRSLVDAYAVPGSIDGAPTPSTTSGPTIGSSPTTYFASRWNCTLDISVFALPAQSRQATFRPTMVPPPQQPSGQPSGAPAPRLSLYSTITSRNSRSSDTLEAVAGSKRHTISSLASLANKSPTLSRKGPPRPMSFPRGLGTLDLPRPTPSFSLDGQTPGATGGPPKRFFSLPPQGLPSPRSPRLSSYGDTRSPLPTPAFPPHFSTRPSFPAVEALRRPDLSASRTSSEAKRESWTAGSATVVSSVGTSPHRAPPSPVPSNHTATSQPGLGLNFGGAGQAEGFPNEYETPHAGNVLVSVALMPLRDFNSSEGPFRDEHDSLGSESEGSRPGTSLAFPASSSMPITPSATGAWELGSRTPIGLLDVFLVEIFVFNRGDTVKRFTVGVPTKRGADDFDGDAHIATIIPLENDVRIG